jgi:hypothetical protein
MISIASWVGSMARKVEVAGDDRAGAAGNDRDRELVRMRQQGRNDRRDRSSVRDLL